MKFNSKKLLVYIFVILFLVIVGYLYVYYLSVIDTNNVKLEGFVFDKKTKKPIDSAIITVNNHRYESDSGYKNYDEYLGYDKIILYTNKNGYYSTVIEKSAYLLIDIEKKSYKKYLEDGKYSSKTMCYETYLISKNADSVSVPLVPAK